MFSCVPVPNDYVCFRCKLIGHHWIMHCPSSHQNNDIHQPIHSLFTNDKDAIQCISIFDQIENCQLIKILNIPTHINKDIAEHATGRIVKCHTSDCNVEAVILYQDRNDYGYCFENMGYCSDCIKTIKKCPAIEDKDGKRCNHCYIDNYGYCYECGEIILCCFCCQIDCGECGYPFSQTCYKYHECGSFDDRQSYNHK